MRNALARLWRAELFSPRWLLLHAALIVLVFGVCHVSGLREHTTFLSGTVTATDGNREMFALLGVFYLSAYFALVLVAPGFVIAAILISVMNRLGHATRASTTRTS